MRVVLVGLNLSRELYSAGLACLYASINGDAELRRLISVVFLNFCVDDSPDWIFSRVWKARPDVVACSIVHGNGGLARRLARSLRLAAPQIKLVWGGIEVSPSPVYYLEDVPELDVVVRGEGEFTFVELLRRLMKGEDSLTGVSGLTWRDTFNRIVHEPDRPPEPDLDVYRSALLDGLVPIAGPGQIAHIETYRGCPFNCGYCFEHRGFSGVRSYSVPRITTELGVLLRNRAGLIRFYDTTFNYDRDRMVQLLTYVVSNNHGTRLHAEMRLELLDEHSIRLMRDAGFAEIEFGLQTTNRGTLDACGREWDRELCEYNCRLLHRYGLSPVFHVIGGLPGDTIDDFRSSIDYVQEVLSARLVLFPFMLIRGSTFSETTERMSLGIRCDDEPPYHALCHHTFSVDDFVTGKSLIAAHDLLDSYLGSPSISAWILSRFNCTRSELYSRFLAWFTADEEADIRMAKDLPNDRQLELILNFVDDSADPASRPVIRDALRFNWAMQVVRRRHNERIGREGQRQEARTSDRFALDPETLIVTFETDLVSCLDEPARARITPEGTVIAFTAAHGHLAAVALDDLGRTIVALAHHNLPARYIERLAGEMTGRGAHAASVELEHLAVRGVLINRMEAHDEGISHDFAQ